MKHLEEETKALPNWGEEDAHKHPPAPGASQRSDLDESLEHPAAYRAFVQSPLAKVEPKLGVKLDGEIQAEIANLTRLLATVPPNILATNRVYFELAFDLIGAEQPNLLLIKSIRVQMAAPMRDPPLESFG